MEDIDNAFAGIIRVSYKTQGAVDASERKASVAYVIKGILDLEMFANGQ